MHSVSKQHFRAYIYAVEMRGVLSLLYDEKVVE